MGDEWYGMVREHEPHIRFMKKTDCDTETGGRAAYDKVVVSVIVRGMAAEGLA